MGARKYLLLFALIFVEGPIATMLGAAAASAGFMRLSLVILVAVAANLMADIGWYALGYFSKEATLIRYLGWLGCATAIWMRWAGPCAAMPAKCCLLPNFPQASLSPRWWPRACPRLPLRRWFPVVFLAGIGWSTLLALIGFYAVEAVEQVQVGLHYMAMVGLAVLFALIIYLIRRGMRSTRSFVEEIDKESGRLVTIPPRTQPDRANPTVTPGD